MKTIIIIIITVFSTILIQNMYKFTYAYESQYKEMYSKKDIARYACYTFNVPMDEINQKLRVNYDFKACK